MAFPPRQSLHHIGWSSRHVIARTSSKSYLTGYASRFLNDPEVTMGCVPQATVADNCLRR